MGKSNKNFPMTSSVTQVQGSNDWSIVSKYSTVISGYYEDKLLQYFVSKPARRSPLIHRGYYVRYVAMNTAIRRFLTNFPNQKKQIISYGAGFDSTFFRLQDSGTLENCIYREIDFPEVVERKRKIIATTPELQTCISTRGTECSNYQILAADLRSLSTLERQFQECQISFELPTLIFSECAITYMDEASSSELIEWTAARFSQAVFMNYEQVYGNDNFGIVMSKHFQTLSSPLLSLPFYPTVEDQENRYTKRGWDQCSALGINQIYDRLSRKEKQRISLLEPFDEHEPLRCKCNHYLLIMAYKNTPVFQDLLPAPLELTNFSCMISMDLTQLEVQRWGHASAKYQGKIMISGGFGFRTELQLHHARLDDLTELDLSPKPSNAPQLNTKMINAVFGRMYHSMTRVHCNGTELLVMFGGRKSPLLPLNDIVMVDPSQSTTRILSDNADSPSPRWRHTAAAIQLDDQDCVVITGGKTNESVLDDCWIFNAETCTWKTVGNLPSARHSHSAASWQNRVIIAGGLSQDEAVLDDVLLLRDVKWCALTIEPKPVPRFSHQAAIVHDTLLLLGGVTCLPHLEPGLSVINLVSFSCQEYRLTVQDPSRPLLLQGFTVVYDEYANCLRTIGGGANCFSFGTHLNQHTATFHLDKYGL